LGFQGQFGLTKTLAEPINLLSGGRFVSPYLALTDEADSLVVDQELGDSLAVRFGFASQDPERQGDFEHGPTMTIVGEFARRWPSGSQLALQFGGVEERYGVLDSVGGGALGLPSTSSTSFFGLNGRLTLSERLALLGQASFGVTDPGPAENSLIRDMSALHSFGFGAALAGRDLLASNDRLMIAASQPLRVYVGSAVVRRPIERTIEGRIISRNDKVDLEPDGREVDLELGYSLPLGRNRELSFNWLTQLEPGHKETASPAHTLALRLRAEF
jgi:hypothetical protein